MSGNVLGDMIVAKLLETCLLLACSVQQRCAGLHRGFTPCQVVLQTNTSALQLLSALFCIRQCSCAGCSCFSQVLLSLSLAAASMAHQGLHLQQSSPQSLALLKHALMISIPLLQALHPVIGHCQLTHLQL